MEKDNKKRNKLIGISLGIIAVIAIIAGSTYAYWQITKTQKNANDIVAACLNFTIENERGAFGLEDAAPLTDAEGAALNGYTFSVENKCDEAVNYIVGLDALEHSSGKYLSHDNLKVKLDKKSAKIYSSLKDAGNPNVLASKQLSLETVEGKGTNTHNVKIWIKSDAPVSEQGKGFTGQVFITGGQGIGDSENGCFTIADDGTILGYDISCGTDVVVPASINGIDVKEINSLSFNNYNMGMIAGNYGELVMVSGKPEYSKQDSIAYFRDEEIASFYREMMKQEVCAEDANCDFEQVMSELGMYILVGPDDYNAHDWSKYEEIISGEFMFVTIDEVTGEPQATTRGIEIANLDLSEATELEKIGSYTIYGRVEYDEAINDSCEYDTSRNKYICNGDFSTVIFPENGKLKEIGGYAFYGNRMSEITIPSTVETIGENAFEDNNISTLKFTDTSSNPSSLTTIEDGAFEKNNLTKVVIPGSVTSIGSAPFYGNYELSDIIIKRASSDGLSTDSLDYLGWDSNTQTNKNAKIIYDPNYTE